MARRRAGQLASRPVIYCVVPESMAEELFDKLTDYYADDPNVTVIVDRRRTSRRGPGDPGNHADPSQRQMRDRRRLRVPGDHPDLTTE
jgi:hypothetical protein